MPYQKNATPPQHRKTITIPATGEVLELSWSNAWANFTMSQNGRLLCQMRDKEDLKVASRAVTQAGKTLITMLNQDGHLEIWCDGRELLSGSRSGDINYISKACGSIRFCGYGYALIGAVAAFEGGLNGWAIIFGSLCLLCFFFAWMAERTGKKIYLQMAWPLCSVFALSSSLFGKDIKEDIQNGIAAAKA
jgi:hypothetical protein